MRIDVPENRQVSVDLERHLVRMIRGDMDDLHPGVAKSPERRESTAIRDMLIDEIPYRLVRLALQFLRQSLIGFLKPLRPLNATDSVRLDHYFLRSASSFSISSTG